MSVLCQGDTFSKEQSTTKGMDNEARDMSHLDFPFGGSRSMFVSDIMDIVWCKGNNEAETTLLFAPCETLNLFPNPNLPLGF
jgi:hypothetical protein